MRVVLKVIKPSEFLADAKLGTVAGASNGMLKIENDLDNFEKQDRLKPVLSSHQLQMSET